MMRMKKTACCRTNEERRHQKVDLPKTEPFVKEEMSPLLVKQELMTLKNEAVPKVECKKELISVKEEITPKIEVSDEDFGEIDSSYAKWLSDWLLLVEEAFSFRRIFMSPQHKSACLYAVPLEITSSLNGFWLSNFFRVGIGDLDATRGRNFLMLKSDSSKLSMRSNKIAQMVGRAYIHEKLDSGANPNPFSWVEELLS